MKRATKFAALAGATALLLSACGQAPDENGATGDGENVDFKACMVSDEGGWDDQSFNQSGHEGLMRAADELGVTPIAVESQAETDFGPNVDNLVQQGCNLIIGVGFKLEEAIQEAAEANPDINFALIDSSFTDEDFNPVTIDNAKPILFNTSEAAFLAGFLAAGMTETGTVATFGGLQIPSVSIFMDGFYDGVQQFNEDNDADVTVLGWDKAAQTGSFTGDFSNQANGQNLTQGFIDQGADIIMPVAGPVGLGAAAAASDAGKRLIWVDADGFLTTEHGDLMITSVMKQIGAAVFDVIDAAAAGNFSPEPYVGTLENEGVGLAPFHDFEGEVPAELVEQLDAYKAKIISGELVIESPSSPK
ncbi:basic membrane lipoprotein [Xylanimonas cellulosilytica DSM 15894]|uniref:Basic membrane lipoprotein n=1 Tax=Xylanimonas cellulosilytica (strain DSM 15894 / JCM 12276 / CECT 5975 / KCTC 9989 / LMG 20990 / NBRC 107835 / XIL07) TaxID=446471 RepID=D1BYV0_XYLCX|nr:BMP family ABC transporter substrate-binding protein [Xylanimonas cellulosilytica]ACZ30025.1 basic membrane lipoprotein [Xylanimonas cellulosilytica DSM 15894]